MNTARLVEEAARRHPSVTAVCDDHLALSYEQLWAGARNIAGELRARGLQPGDRVALVMANCAEYLLAMVACWAGGLVIVPVNRHLHEREIAYILGHSGAGAVVVTEDEAVRMRNAARHLARDRLIPAGQLRDAAADPGHTPGQEPGSDAGELAWLFYTSGTTGRPKGAALTHGNLAAMARAYDADIAQLEPGDRLVHFAPLSHGSGLYALPALARGAQNIIFQGERFDGAAAAEVLSASRATVVPFLSPVMLSRLADGMAGTRLPDLRCVVYGGAPIRYRDVSRALDTLGPVLTQIYGQGEAPMTITSLSPAEHLRLQPDGRVPAGYPRTGVEVQIKQGEVCVRGAVVMRGYWNDPEATARAIPDGWLHTGDIGVQGDDGRLTLVDRANDLIITGGFNVHPSEVELALQSHPDVRDVVVFGIPDDDWGEAVAAAVVLAPGARPDDLGLQDWCLRQMARFKRPRGFLIVDELPRNAYGKVMRRAARDAFLAAGESRRPL